MKLTKLLRFIFLMTILMIGFTATDAQTKQCTTWKITVSQSGGFAGIMKSYTLDKEGNLNRINKDQRNFEKIDEARMAEIDKLVEELNLPRTKLKTVKGSRIYDGIYNSFVISLDGKDYKVAGNSFDDAQFTALSKKQTETLAKLKAKIDELGGFQPDATTNQMN